jgi:hypothetical protein
MIDEETARKYRETFDQVADKDDWKKSTKPITVGFSDVENLMRAITFFAGGAECKINHKEGTCTITSKGYYHYIGA